MDMGAKTKNRNSQINTNTVKSGIIIFQLKSIVQQNFSNYIQIYTDISKSNYEAGFSVVKNKIIMQHKLSKITCIFSAENDAIYEGIQPVNNLE